MGLSSTLLSTTSGFDCVYALMRSRSSFLYQTPYKVCEASNFFKNRTQLAAILPSLFKFIIVLRHQPRAFLRFFLYTVRKASIPIIRAPNRHSRWKLHFAVSYNAILMLCDLDLSLSKQALFFLPLKRFLFFLSKSLFSLSSNKCFLVK